MLDPLSLMKLVPKAKMLVAMMKEVAKEQESNIKKYNIKQSDLKEYNKMKEEIQAILEKDKS